MGHVGQYRHVCLESLSRHSDAFLDNHKKLVCACLGLCAPVAYIFRGSWTHKTRSYLNSGTYVQSRVMLLPDSHHSIFTWNMAARTMVSRWDGFEYNSVMDDIQIARGTISAGQICQEYQRCSRKAMRLLNGNRVWNLKMRCSLISRIEFIFLTADGLWMLSQKCFAGHDKRVKLVDMGVTRASVVDTVQK